MHILVSPNFYPDCSPVDTPTMVILPLICKIYHGRGNIFDVIDLCPQVDGVVEKDDESFVLSVYTNA